MKVHLNGRIVVRMLLSRNIGLKIEFVKKIYISKDAGKYQNVIFSDEYKNLTF